MENKEILRQCFAVLVDNQPGVLSRVIGMFAGRGYNIESLSVDKVEDEVNLSRITIVCCGTREALNQIMAQLRRLVPVQRAMNLGKAGALIERSYALVKICCTSKQKPKVVKIVERTGGRELNQTEGATIYELVGSPDEIRKAVSALQKLGLVEIASSGSVAISCGKRTIYK